MFIHSRNGTWFGLQNLKKYYQQIFAEQYKYKGKKREIAPEKIEIYTDEEDGEDSDWEDFE